MKRFLSFFLALALVLTTSTGVFQKEAKAESLDYGFETVNVMTDDFNVDNWTNGNGEALSDVIMSSSGFELDSTDGMTYALHKQFDRIMGMKTVMKFRLIPSLSEDGYISLYSNFYRDTRAIGVKIKKAAGGGLAFSSAYRNNNVNDVEGNTKVLSDFNPDQELEVRIILKEHNLYSAEVVQNSVTEVLFEDVELRNYKGGSFGIVVNKASANLKSVVVDVDSYYATLPDIEDKMTGEIIWGYYYYREDMKDDPASRPDESAYDPDVMARAFDGKADALYTGPRIAGTYNGVGTSYIGLDLGEGNEQALTFFRVLARDDISLGSSVHILQGSKNGEDYDTLWSLPYYQVPGGRWVNNEVFNKEKYRYYRVIGSAYFTASFYEVEFYALPDGADPRPMNKLINWDFEYPITSANAPHAWTRPNISANKVYAVAGTGDDEGNQFARIEFTERDSMKLDQAHPFVPNTHFLLQFKARSTVDGAILYGGIASGKDDHFGRTKTEYGTFELSTEWETYTTYLYITADKLEMEDGKRPTLQLSIDKTGDPEIVGYVDIDDVVLMEIPVAEAPNITPEAVENAEAPISVTITAEEGAEIRYTLDGSEPSRTEGLVYDGPISIGYGENITVKAVSVVEGKGLSPINEKTYSVKSKLEAPVISPEALENADAPILVTITAEEGADIFYTIDGSNPSKDSAKYTEEIEITYGESVTVKAIAIKEGSIDSDIATVAYSVKEKTEEPSFKTEPVTDSDTPLEVEINIPEGTKVYYVIGSEHSPITDTDDRVEYKAGEKINVEYGETKLIRMVAIEEGVKAYSNIVEGTFSVKQKLNPPQISPESVADSDSEISVTITAEEGASIYFTTDGTEPSSNSTLYTEAIVVGFGEAIDIKAIAIKEACVNSDIAEASYSVKQKTADPVFSPEGGTFKLGIGQKQKITITAEDGAEIFYTLDGSTPTESSTKYDGPISLGKGEVTIKAIAVKDGKLASEVVSATYTVVIKGKLEVKVTTKKITEKTKQISGTATAGSTVFIKVGKKTFSKKVGNNSKWTIRVKNLKAASKIKVYSSLDGEKSKTRNVNVVPSAPTIKKLKAKATRITGKVGYKKVKVTVKVGKKKYTTKANNKKVYKVKVKKLKKKAVVKVFYVYKGKRSLVTKKKV